MLGLFFGEEAGEGDDVGVDLLLDGRSVTVCLRHDCCLGLASRGQ